MQPTDWINAITHLAPTIVAVVAIVVWGLKGSASRGDDPSRQTALLERIAAQLNKSKP